jgi:AcrR family transcriptional regulator
VRITAEAKRATRRRILDEARALFGRGGFEAATTRDLASAAGIATGTLFNYFPSKEAIALALVAEALAGAQRTFEAQPPTSESLEESLFTLIAGELRALRPHRAYVQPVLETALSPLISSDASPEAETIRVAHLEAAGRLIAARVTADSLPPVALNLYWTLYTGVLGFWAGDSSANQEETLAVLDHYLKAFVRSLPQPE